MESDFSNLLSGLTLEEVFLETFEALFESFLEFNRSPEGVPEVEKRFNPVFRRTNRRTVFLKSGTVVAYTHGLTLELKVTSNRAIAVNST